MATRYLAVKNYERYQHYKSKLKEASPAWIKLHRSVLNHYEFLSLDDGQRSHLMLLWVLASQLDNRIPDDPAWVKQQIHATGKVDLAKLIEVGFLVPIESTLERSEESTLERTGQAGLPRGEERREEEMREDQIHKGSEALTADDLVEGWNEHCAPAGLPAVAELSKTRKEKATLRIREHPTTDFWSQVFGNLSASTFLRGMRNGAGKHDKWKANFDWLIENDTNAVKVYEGRYE